MLPFSDWLLAMFRGRPQTPASGPQAAPAPSPSPAAPKPPTPVPVVAVGDPVLSAPKPPFVVPFPSSSGLADRMALVLTGAVNPALACLRNHGVPSDPWARVNLMACAGQEGICLHRRQIGGGPAMGLWQFERGGGVVGVLSHRRSMAPAGALCAWRGVDPGSHEVWAGLERDDILAAGFARLLWWTDPQALPRDEDAAFSGYLRNWRPGAWTRGTQEQRHHLRTKWTVNWTTARKVVFDGKA